MLTITADVFSGRPNPVWFVDDENEARMALDALTKERNLILPDVPPEAGLGFRGVQIELLDDAIGGRFDLPSSFYVPLGHLSRQARSDELIERLVTLLGRGRLVPPSDSATAIDEALQRYLLDQLRQSVTGSQLDAEAQLRGPADGGGAPAPAAITCWIELWAFNPAFWNNDSYTRQHNNCYNYASNWRTNTFAQPGRGSGHMYTAVTCPAVTLAALSDGMHHRFDCFPDGEKPRFLVAMVVSPGPGFVDYHWYRKHQGGFWGHKPGPSYARNVDESNNVIADPQFCNRGPYTQFCGYFYGCNSQRHRIN